MCLSRNELILTALVVAAVLIEARATWCSPRRAARTVFHLLWMSIAALLVWELRLFP